MSPPLEKSILVRASREHAFTVFTQRIDLWWPPSHRQLEASTLRFEGHAGGRFFERAASGEERELGTVLRWEPPHRVSYTWTPGASLGPTHVDIQFVDAHEGTRVEVTHSEGESQLGPQWPQRAKRFEAAWNEVLPAFSNHLKLKGDAK